MIRSSLRRFGIAVVVLAAVPTLMADTVLVPQVVLRESGGGQYVLVASVSPRIAGRVAPPVLPEGCATTSDPTLVRDGAIMTWTIAFECSDALNAGDQLYLPWQVDGIRLTAEWEKGKSPERLFGREGAGIIVAIDALLERSTSPAALGAQFLPLGLRHFFTSWVHVLTVVALAVALGRANIGTVLAGFSTGHAFSLVAAEAGAVGVPVVPAEATLAAAAAIVLARYRHWDDHRYELALVGVVLGATHGLGLATTVAGNGTSGIALVYGLFFAIMAFELSQWIVGLGLASLLSSASEVAPDRQGVVVHSLGVVAAFTVFASMQIGIGSTVVPVEDAGTFDASAPAANQAAGVTVPLLRQTTQTGALAYPFMSYLIVEPYQVRHEVLVSVPAVAQWITVVNRQGMVPVAAQDAIAAQVVDLLRREVVMRIDAADVLPATTRFDWVAVEPTGILTRQRPQPEPFNTAVIGVIFEYATDGLVNDIAVDWGLALGAEVPVLITDPVAQAEAALTEDNSMFTWQNTLGDYELPTIEAIRTEAPWVPLPSIALILGAAVVVGMTRRRSPLVTATLIGAFLIYPFARVSAQIPFVAESRLSTDQAAPILEAMLMNVYRSFDIHEETAIYDRLALTVTGDQLVDVYLESRRALELENRGGATVRIDEVVVRDVRDVRRAEDGGLVIDGIWTVGGSVNHFGHEHFRQNRYDASVTVVPVDGFWKISGIELFEERRMM